MLVPIKVIRDNTRGKIVPAFQIHTAAELNVQAISMTHDEMNVITKMMRLPIKPAINAPTELIRISCISIFLGPKDIVYSCYNSNTGVRALIA